MFCTVYFRTLKNDFEYSTHMFLSLEKKFKNDEAQGVSCFKYEKNHITSFSPYCIFHFLYIYTILFIEHLKEIISIYQI